MESCLCHSLSSIKLSSCYILNKTKKILLHILFYYIWSCYTWRHTSNIYLSSLIWTYNYINLKTLIIEKWIREDFHFQLWWNILYQTTASAMNNYKYLIKYVKNSCLKISSINQDSQKLIDQGAQREMGTSGSLTFSTTNM